MSASQQKRNRDLVEENLRLKAELAVVTQERDEARGLAESRAEAARLRGQAAHEAQTALRKAQEALAGYRRLHVRDGCCGQENTNDCEECESALAAFPGIDTALSPAEGQPPEGG